MAYGGIFAELGTVVRTVCGQCFEVACAKDQENHCMWACLHRKTSPKPVKSESRDQVRVEAIAQRFSAARTPLTCVAASDKFHLEMQDEHIPSTCSSSTFAAVAANMFGLDVLDDGAHLSYPRWWKLKLQQMNITIFDVCFGTRCSSIS